mmetsp:Transcript_31556/g.49418  ORF Transcript_31556/g.49418 Transcript_31556/m.49418 type:complete len:247 (+) Transcript_31556:3-743(+)
MPLLKDGVASLIFPSLLGYGCYALFKDFKVVNDRDLVCSGILIIWLLLVHLFRFGGDRSRLKGSQGQHLADLENKHLSNAWWIPYYLPVAGVIGLLLPWISIWMDDSKVRARVLGSHLFLTMLQIIVEVLGEQLMVAWPVQVLNPICFNAFRLISLSEWSYTILLSAQAASFTDFDKGVALANFVLWVNNLMGFLLPWLLTDYLHPKYQPEMGPEELRKEARALEELAALIEQKQAMLSMSKRKNE